ncbi:unnamed protein product [Oncorhynchus mykiss]|uniref:Zinc finger homeobox protein 4 n=1 Tax=Oncorhynchus mykiss TaxID=8022 RepID=A0A060YQ43_ONCMY|nr:unnamed protein product [Oncorhynchus mykiss]
MLLERQNDSPPKRPKSAERKTSASEQQLQQCPYCNYRSKDANRLQLHVVSQHSMQQPVICCPLCQDVLSNKIHLQLHLTHLHSVAPDCVDKLLMTVAGPDVMVPNSMMYPSPGQDNALSLMEASATLSETSGKPTGNRSKDQMNSTGQDKSEVDLLREELKPPKEGSEAPDWKRSGGVGQDRKSPDSLQDHLNDLQRRQQQQLSVSDRHIYKYRCNHCSLAFKTMQKLQIHSQYHAIRAATMCSLCQRSFRTFLALRKHLENGHPELSEAEVQQLCGSLPVNGDFVPESEARAYEEAQQAFEQEMDKDDELDLEEKASSTGSDSSLLLDDMGAETKRTLPFRKGPNFTMEKFLDPSRPYKCTVCKESFTQKNILLVHYNSVSHLHKLKKVLQEASSPVSPETNNNADNKPFKCNICNVAYSQSSTLEIHMRSVLHHTKVRTAKTETSSSSSSTGIGNTSGMAPSSIPAPTGQGNNANSETARSVTPLVNKENTVDAKEANNSNNAKHTTDHVSAQQSHQNAQSQAQLQMQLQHELQQQAAFFQPQFLNPAFYPQFGMTPEALLQFQQPQFLFPFYIPGAEFNLSPELALHSATAFGMPGLTGSTAATTAAAAAAAAAATSITQPQSHKPKMEPNAVSVSDIHMSRESEEHLEKQESKAKMENGADGVSEGGKDKKDKKSKFPEPLIPPPRIVSGARGNAAKALLENFGFELVIQYNENRQKNQKKNREGEEQKQQPQQQQLEINNDKLECGMCGKLFSNVLILKSHQEHIHGQFFPYGELEKFAQQYREAYDKLYPINPPSPETPPPLPPLPPPSPVPVTTQQPPCTSTNKPQIKAPSPAPNQTPQTQPPPPPPPPPPPSASPQVQPSIPLDFSLFPPLLMQSIQHQGLHPQLTLQLPTMDSLSSDLTQLCQQQLGLDPNFLRQSQFKRPRTRITDDQLKVLRAHFDINNSPTEEQIQEMADMSSLPQKYSTLEYYRTDATMNKRSSRTRFTDYQLRVLQDFFDTNAYPKDDEIEQLSTVLNLPSRVIVVWFQNARQKARKSYENQADAKDNEKKELTNERYIRTSNMQYECKKCSLLSGGLQMPTQSGSGLSSGPCSGSMKRKLDEKEDGSNEKDNGNMTEEQHRDKRLRTTITPEQLEILYDKYLLDSNPTRKMLDHIAREVGLKKRVVQVWFQNTRARERKGQFRALGASQSHKKCPFCRALFKAKSALDSHIRSRHWHEAKQAGFSLPNSPMMNQDDGGESPHKCNFFDFPQLPTKTEPNEYELPAASSTPVKQSEAQLKNLMSPSSLKAENCDESEGLNINSAEGSSYDINNKMDFDETSSINTAISDATTGDEGNNNELESLMANGGDKLACDSKSNLAQSSDGGDDRFPFSMVSPSLSYSGKDGDSCSYSYSYYSSRDDDMDDNNDQSETSSLTDPSSPSPFGSGNPFRSGKGSGSGGERPGHKRFRTQMSNLQLKVLKACFSDYRTPTMQECEMLGSEMGLPKRVVQVWFQNARAKEKKFKINIGKPFMISQGGPDGPRPECTLCNVKYTARMSIRDHIFSKQHIAKVQETLVNQVDREKDYLAPTTVRQLMAQQEMDRLKRAGSDGLSNLAAQQLQIAVNHNNALHGLSLPSGYPGISGLPPVLLPGVTGPSSLPIYPPNTPALASPGAGMLGFPNPATPSPAMSLSTTPNKNLLQTPPPPPPLPPVSSTPLTSTNHIEQHSKYQERESNNNSSSSKKPAEKPHHQKKAKEREVENGGRLQTPISNNKKREKPSPASGKPGREGHLDAAQLQALQNALTGAADPSSFLGGQFLPYFLPGFANSFSPQILGGMQAGGYFPPFGGMENLFPYGPAAIPQAAMAGMNPTALLQQYQQYQLIINSRSRSQPL